MTTTIGTRLDDIPAEARTVWDWPPLPPPAEWCEANVRLSVLTSAMPGRFSTDMYPFVKGVLDDWIDPAVEKMTLEWGTQLGKTTLLACILAYCAVNDPGPTMVVGAVETSVRELSTTRIYPMLEDCEATAGLMLPQHEQLDLLIDLQRQLVFFGWSGSVSRVSEKNIRYLLCTEIDKWSRERSTEGDSLSLAEERTKAYPNRKHLYESSPSIRGLSRIEASYDASDRRTYRVPCPHCGRYQALKFGGKNEAGGLKWPRDRETGHSCTPAEARERAWYECEHCEGRINDEHKIGMLQAGAWVPAGQAVRRATSKEIDAGRAVVEAYNGTPLVITGEPTNPITTHRGYHLSSLYSPTLTFGQVAARWLDAQGDFRQEQTFYNGWLALPWELTPDVMKWEALANRCRDGRRAGVVPDETAALIATADVGKHRIHWVVRAWLRNGTSWLVSYGECASLDEFDTMTRQAVWHTAGGEPRYVTMALVDARYRTSDVEAYVHRCGLTVRAIMGDKLKKGTYSFFSDAKNAVTGRRIRVGAGKWHLYSDVFKEQLVAMQNRDPADHEAPWWLHAEVDENYLRQVTAEALVEEKDTRGRTVYKWRVIHPRPGNHYFDCEYYQVAAWRMYREGWQRLRSADRPPGVPAAHRRRRQEPAGDEFSGRAFDGTLGGDEDEE